MSWPLVRLGEVAPSKALKNPVVVDDDNVWQLNLDMVESGSGRILKKLKAPLSEAGSSTHWFDDRHILYSKLRPYLNKVVLPDEEGLATTELVPMLPDPKRLDRRYLVHYLRSKQFVSWISDQVAGAKMPRVSMKVFWDHEIPLPPVEEQKRIAAILDKADAMRQKRKQAIDLADEFLRSVFLDMFGDPVTNPKGFPVGTIRDIISTVNYGSSSKASETDGEFPILRMGNITYKGGWNFSDLKYIDLDDKEQGKYLALKNDLLFNRTNSKELVGKTAVFNESKPMAIAGYLIRVRTNQVGNPWYISGYLNSSHGKKTLTNMCKSIVGMANINAQELQDIKILLPSIELQNRYESIVREVNERMSRQHDSGSELQSLFDALSQKAFSGQL
ncbi:restriction endonuclease [Vibrio splendidus]|uniref:restriction endonuclease subunit S n=1 Tax=Vibrio splendidus TaxID=29497 RepID=UPI000D38D858|nr:restriction endonuclease subunit S [Vibrio splendidus]PTP61168.1 restriction endonuclease [Vibrio splendidus]